MYSLYGTWGFPCEFPHSEISGSLAMCAYPKLIAAYHVLHRLLMPRHSPCALCSLTYQVNFSKYLHLISQRIFLGYFSYLKLYINSCAIFKEHLEKHGFSKLNRVVNPVIFRVRSKHLVTSFIHRKEVIQPQVLLRLPCYDFTPIADPTLGGFLPYGLDHQLWVLPTLMV